MTRTQIVSIAAVIGLVVSVALRLRSQSSLQQREASLRLQQEQLAQLATENLRLSSLAAHSQNIPQDADNTELARLRNEVESLQRKTNELARSSQKQSQSVPARSSEPSQQHAPEYWENLHQMAGGKPQDARNLAVAFQSFANDHQGQFPSELEQVTSYLKKEGLSLSGTNRFEIIYHGSLNELEGLPIGSVAVIRDSQTWRGPEGRMHRVYGMTGGIGQIVESADNFQSWEAKHVISPAKIDPLIPK